MKKAYRKWLFKRRCKKLEYFLLKIHYTTSSWPRQKKKQFWRDFIKSEKFRKDCFEFFPEAFG